MFSALRIPSFRKLFAAHVIALIGTGMSTIAIGFLVFDIAGDGSAAALGTLLAIKMATYLAVGPFAPAIASRVGAKRLLVMTDIARALVACALPFVDSVAVAYLLTFVLQSTAALFTPTFQATIPTVVTDKHQYTGALALSRLAYDFEALVSPTIASALLILAPSSTLFFGTSIGFVASALLIFSAVIPRTVRTSQQSIRQEVSRGTKLMLSIPTLRGVLSMHLALAFVGSIVMVLSVPLVRGALGGDESEAASLLAAFGAGSIISAVLMPRLVKKFGARSYMLTGLTIMSSAMLLVWPALQTTSGIAALPLLWVLWFFAGLGNSAVLAPMGRVIRDTVAEEDLAHVFAAQFALAHGWWLIAYPLAGWAATIIGYERTTFALATLALVTAFITARLWPATRLAAEARA